MFEVSWSRHETEESGRYQRHKFQQKETLPASDSASARPPAAALIRDKAVMLKDQALLECCKDCLDLPFRKRCLDV